MMGQELFERPKRQYAQYRIEALEELSAQVGPVEDVDELSDEQAAALEQALEQHPESAVTFDELSQQWIVGAGDDINRMFHDREEFIEALENNEDPGV